jgi:hypothetical protein
MEDSIMENNNNAKIFEPSYYAKTYFNNYETNMSINITYSSGLMKLSIGNRSSENGRSEEIINASLTGLKAQLLVNAMDQMEKDIIDGTAEGKSYGTSVGMGDVVKAVAFTVENGEKKFIIAKVSKDGHVSEKTTYTFAKDSNYFMDWTDFDAMKFSKHFDNDIEITLLKNALADFSRGLSGAAAYGGLYLNRYEQGRDRNKISSIMDKLGISVRQGGQSYNRSNSNYFSNTEGNRSSEHKSFADIDSMLGSEDDDE